MRVAHLSDLHLGHRLFPRLERGGNLRERDVAGAFQQAIQEVVRLAPDLVLLSGDLFHSANPPSTAFLTLTREIRRLQDLLPGVPVIAIAGECDTPMAPGDPGPVAVLDAVPGVEAAAGAPRAVHLAALSAHVLLVPHRAVVRPPFPELRPDPRARWNLLLLRGHPMGGTRGAPAGSHLALDPEGWDYVALGGPHRRQSWGPSIHCAGSLERVGADPWSEAAMEKGFLLADLERGEVELHQVPARPVVDLAPVRITSGDPEPGTRRLRELLEGFPGGVEGKLVRVRLQGDILSPSEGVSPGLLAGIRRKAAHLEVRVEAPGDARAHAESVSSPHLEWAVADGRRGQATLTPGLWAVTAVHPADLEEAARALEETRFPAPREAMASGGGEGRTGASLRFLVRGTDGIPVTGTSPVQRPPAHDGAPQAPSVAATSPRPPVSRGAGASAAVRGDWIEAAGDAEARALEWARDRQEADSRLLAYRERARELRERIRLLREEGASAPCPTCRRPLAEAHPALLDLLEEEWEEVVQDGTWWKRRRAQLEEKPADLLALERTALRLQSRMGEAAEEEEGATVGRGSETSGAPDLPSRARMRDAGFLLQRATEGRLEGVRVSEEGRLLLVEAGGHVRSPSRDDDALTALALEGAAAREEAGVHLLLAGRSGVREDEVVRLLDAVSADPGPYPWIAVVPPSVAGALPHRLQGTLELTRDDEDRLRLRLGPPGRARLDVREGPREGPAPAPEFR